MGSDPERPRGAEGVIPVIMFVLSLMGLWISVYFTGVYYKWFTPHVFWVPQVCRLEEANCITILGTPRAKLFGLPNSIYGMAMYLYLMVDVVFFPPHLAIVMLALAVLRSLYLAYSLLFVTKVSCPLCFTSHVINLALFLLVFKIAFSG